MSTHQFIDLLLSSPGWFLDALSNASMSDAVASLQKGLGSFYETNPATSVFLFFFGVYYVYYLKNVVRKPELVCCEEKFKKFLQEHCPIFEQEFRPTLWCAHTHAQTLLANGIRAVIPIPKYTREYIPVSNDFPPRKDETLCNDKVDNPTNKLEAKNDNEAQQVKSEIRSHVSIDWYEGPGTSLPMPTNQQCCPEPDWSKELVGTDEQKLSEDNGKPIALFIPGLVGDSQTEYIRTAVTMTNGVGYKVAVYNNRARGGMRIKTPRLYCATNYDDLEACLRQIKRSHPDSRIVAVGISLGGIVLCRYLAEKGDKALVDAAMLVSVCFDFIEGCKSLSEPGLNSALNTHLTKSLLRVVYENKDVYSSPDSGIDFDSVMASKNLREFDDKFTRILWGYDTVDEYHKDASNSKRVAFIKKPTLCINAADDIFCPYRFLPLDEIRDNPHCAMIVTARGGHIGFMEGLLPYVPSFYLERVITQYLAAVKSIDNLSDICP